MEPGDRVALVTGEKLPFLAAHLGAIYAGGVSLPLNPRFTRDELRYFLADSEARVAVVGAEQRPVIESLRPELPALLAVVDDDAAWEAPEGHDRNPSIDADAPCLILYSSGTTGRPKGVVHTHANLAASLHALRDLLAVHARRRAGQRPAALPHPRPLVRHPPQPADRRLHGRSRRASTRAGRSRSSARARSSWRSRRSITPSSTGPNSPRPPGAGATCGSSPAARRRSGRRSCRDWRRSSGRPVINRYGMTEGHVITSLPLDGPWPQGSVGLPLPGIELRIARDDGTPASPGEAGPFCCAGRTCFANTGAIPKPPAPRSARAGSTPATWARWTSAGFLTLVGRKNDLIITSGFNVYPQVVERVLNECPGVRESAVVGLPDDRRGERVAAVVVRDDPALDERRLRSHCAERLVDYQRPSTVIFVDDLPRNAMGKVLRRELRDLLVQVALGWELSPDEQGRSSRFRGRVCMVLAWISLAALIVVIVASCTTTINPGVLAIVFAWVIGVYLGAMLGKPIGLKAVMAGFPTELFLTLVGVTRAVRAGADQRNARAAGTRGGALLPGERGPDARSCSSAWRSESRRSGRATSRPRRWSARWRWRSPGEPESRPS